MSSSPKGTLYLIPNVLAEGTADAVITHQVRALIERLDFYLAENLRTARRYLRTLGIQRPIEELQIDELSKRTPDGQLSALLGPLRHGHSIGVLSEAGVPGIADPGARAVALAHYWGYPVVPLVGPSSFVLALMASGFNGQSFAFHGYLPIDKGPRHAAIKQLEKEVERSGQTQLFMETPYRNHNLLQDLTKHLKPSTLLCIACDLTSEQEFIRTQPISQWAKSKEDLHKRPAVFLLGRTQ